MDLLILLMCCCSCLSAACGLGCLFLLSRPAESGGETPPWEDSPPEEDKKPDGPGLRMEEGFENLMAYQVKLGRGRSTGGEA